MIYVDEGMVSAIPPAILHFHTIPSTNDVARKVEISKKCIRAEDDEI
jgi:hypothetical protein